MYKKFSSIIILLLLVFSWEFFISKEMSFLFPPPSQILSRTWEIKTTLIDHTLTTLTEMFLGLFFALILSVISAYLMWRSNWFYHLAQPLIVLMQCMPVLTLAPLLILWFGWGLIPIVIPTTLLIFFPLTMTLYKGLCNTPKSYLDYFKQHQASNTKIFFRLQLPWSVPYLFAGIRISCALACLAAITGEWVGGQKGLGVLMLEAKRSYDIKTTFAALLAILIITLSLFSVTLLIEKIWGKRFSHA